MKKILSVLLFFSSNFIIFCQDNRIDYFLSFIGMDIKQLQENIAVSIQKDSRWNYYEAKNYPEDGRSTTFFIDNNNKIESISVHVSSRKETPKSFENYFNEYINKIIEIYGKPISTNENSTVISWNRFFIVRKGYSIFEFYE